MDQVEPGQDVLSAVHPHLVTRGPVFYIRGTRDTCHSQHLRHVTPGQGPHRDDGEVVEGRRHTESQDAALTCVVTCPGLVTARVTAEDDTAAASAGDRDTDLAQTVLTMC